MKNISSRFIFFLAPVFLIAAVFFVTFLFSFFLKPLLLSVPLLISYYGIIWGFIVIYQNKYLAKKALLQKKEIFPSFRELSFWMVLWTGVYPFAVGLPLFIFYGKYLSMPWILLGVIFSLINGPSEESFWRLFMERAGQEGGVGQKTRLWYSSAVFSSWHFIFILFLFPKEMFLYSLVFTIAITLISGLLWMVVYQKTKNIFPNFFSHTVLNFLMIWPFGAATILGTLPKSICPF